MVMNKNKNHSDLTIVIFGITGDLVKNKIFKAIGEWKKHSIFGLKHILERDSKLNIIGVGRKNISPTHRERSSRERCLSERPAGSCIGNICQ